MGRADEWDGCFDLQESRLQDAAVRIATWSSEKQMEYMRILENRYLQTQPRILTDMALHIIEHDGINPLVRLETIRWWRDAGGLPYPFRSKVIPLLARFWRSTVAPRPIGTAYLLNYLSSIVEAFGIAPDERAPLVPLLEDILDGSQDILSEDFRYKSMMQARHYLAVSDFTKLLVSLWSTFGTGSRLLLIQFLVAHPRAYDRTILHRSFLFTFLEEQIRGEDSTPWDRADASFIVLNMESFGSITDDQEDSTLHERYKTLSLRAQQLLREEYEMHGGDHDPRRGVFYHNPENVHCISMESAQEILDYLHQEFPTTPHHGSEYYDSFIRACLSSQPTPPAISGDDESRVWTSMCRIAKDYSVHGRHRDRLIHILRLVVNYIEKQDPGPSASLRQRLLEELVDMAGTCSTGFAVRLLNVLSGFADFSIRIPPEHALRCRFFHYLNQAILAIDDETRQSQIMDELTLPVSHYGDRIHFLEFFAAQLPPIKESLYTDFKDSMSDTDFDFYLRKCIYHYEGGLGNAF